MPIQNLGYRAINKLETPADFKLLNDTLRALWVKMLGNIGSKDVNGEISDELTGEFGTRMDLLTARVTAAEAANAAQADALDALDKADEGIKGTAARLEARVAALEGLATSQGEHIVALEEATAALMEWQTALTEWQTALTEWQTETNALLARMNERLKALDGLEG